MEKEQGKYYLGFEVRGVRLREGFELKFQELRACSFRGDVETQTPQVYEL